MLEDPYAFLGARDLLAGVTADDPIPEHVLGFGQAEIRGAAEIFLRLLRISRQHCAILKERRHHHVGRRISQVGGGPHEIGGSARVGGTERTRENQDRKLTHRKPIV
jgi:hypothetical protein